MRTGLTRRRFLGRGAHGALALALVPRGILHAQSPSERLNVAFIGTGGRGAGNLEAIARCGVNVVALCDVDRNQLDRAARSHPGARTYADFRKMLDQKDIDAVVISTPDHLHAVASMAAIQRRKHVYCEKPLCHSIEEARRLTEEARNHKVVTQMGIGGHALEGTRAAVEWVQSGVIGAVREVHLWTDRPRNWWPQGVQQPSGADPVPAGLEWNLWIGPAPHRPYKHLWEQGPFKGRPVYHPFSWRGWIDFGTGALGDMGCHLFDVACWALKLPAPTRVEAETALCNGQTYPEWSVVRYWFPARDELPAVLLTWYDGGRLPPRPRDLEKGKEIGSEDGGVIFIGQKATMILPLGGTPRLVPDQKMRDFKRPDPFLPRSIGHHREWVQACRGLAQAGASFAYSGPLTETVLLGNVAIRAGTAIEWDAARIRITNCPQANQFLSRQYRQGWTL